MVPSKSVVPIDDTDILDLRAGAICKVGFDGVFYKAKVIEHGMLVRICFFSICYGISL